MADENDKSQGGEVVQPQGGNNNGLSQGDSITNAGDLTPAQLKAKIDELERDNANYRKLKRDHDAALEAAEQKRLEDEKKWEDLYKKADQRLRELQPIVDKHESTEKAFNASLDNRLKQIPEDIRKDLVDPVRAGMSPVDFSNWLDRNLPRLAARQAPELDGGAGSSAGKLLPTLTAEQKQMAAFMGMTEKEYADQLQKIEKLRGDTPILGDKK